MSSSDHYAFYGSLITPVSYSLDAMDPVSVQNKRLAKLADKAVDPKSGKLLRFHGAFTGGYNSGYFNTVSSVEGWTPGKFISSRDQKADSSHHQRPEDYMDDEDFSDYGIAPKGFYNTSKFELSDRTLKSSMRDDLTDSLLDKTSLASFSNFESIGYDIMRKLGWKDGQGVGPLIRKPKRLINKYMTSVSQNNSIQPMETNPVVDSSKLILNNTNDVIINELTDQLPSAHEINYTSNQNNKKAKDNHSSVSDGEVSDESINDFDLVATLNSLGTPTSSDQQQLINTTITTTATATINTTTDATNATTSRTTTSDEMFILCDRGDSYQIAPSDLRVPHYQFKNDKKGIGFTGITLDSHASRYDTNYSNFSYSLFSHNLKDPYSDAQDKLYATNLQYKSSSRPTEWYDTEMASGSGSEGNDADENYGWSGGSCVIKMSSFEPGGVLNVYLPKCDVIIPPNYIPSLHLTNIKGNEVKPHTNYSADKRGSILGEPIQLSHSTKQMKSSVLNPSVPSLSSKFIPAQAPLDPTPQKQPQPPIQATPKPEDENKTSIEWHPHRILCKRFNVPDPYPESAIIGLPFRSERVTFNNLVITPKETKSESESEPNFKTVCTPTSQDYNPPPPINTDHIPSTDLRPPVDLFTSVFGSDSSSSESELEEETANTIHYPGRQLNSSAITVKKEAKTASQLSLTSLAQLASKEITKQRADEENRKRKQSKFVGFDDSKLDVLPKFSLTKALGPDLLLEIAKKNRTIKTESKTSNIVSSSISKHKKHRNKHSHYEHESSSTRHKHHSSSSHNSSSSNHKRKYTL